MRYSRLYWIQLDQHSWNEVAVLMCIFLAKEQNSDMVGRGLANIVYKNLAFSSIWLIHIVKGNFHFTCKFLIFETFYFKARHVL